MYEKIDSGNIKPLTPTGDMVSALKNNNLELLTKSMYNIFEEVVKEDKDIIKAKKALENSGAMANMLSGSGSCVFGIYENRKKAKEAYNVLKKDYEAYICTSYNSRRKNFE